MKNALLIAAVSGLVLGAAAQAHAADGPTKDPVAKAGKHSCKGQNACKGQGITVTGTALECTATNGVPTP